MKEQKMTDEQLSQEPHKRNGGRAGGTLLSLLCGTMLFSLCSQSVAAAAGTQTGSSIIVSTSNLCEHQPEHDDECGYSEGTTRTQTIAIRKCSSASINMMMNVAIPPLPGEHHANLHGMEKKNKSAGI